jgi:hypothetical protein
VRKEERCHFAVSVRLKRLEFALAPAFRQMLNLYAKGQAVACLGAP